MKQAAGGKEWHGAAWRVQGAGNGCSLLRMTESSRQQAAGSRQPEQAAGSRQQAVEVDPANFLLVLKPVGPNLFQVALKKGGKTNFNCS
jgi:hypothetical protein